MMQVPTIPVTGQVLSLMTWLPVIILKLRFRQLVPLGLSRLILKGCREYSFPV